MEITITETDSFRKPNLCLNMIVKNESHVIENTLDKLLKKVIFDYWVISDTGSTDNTKQIITNFFAAKNIPGELFDDEWKDFGHNRTKALEHAYGKSKYILVFDADDEICGDFILPELTQETYALQFGDVNGTRYIRHQIISNHRKWKYIGVLHETIVNSEDVNGFIKPNIINGNYYTVSGRTGSRSKDENKYLKDALILEKEYEIAVTNKDTISNRYSFYCANSYYDSGIFEQAIKWYKIAIENDSCHQEKYVSCLKIYICYKALNKQTEGFGFLVKSLLYDIERVECIYELVVYYCLCGLKDVAYGYYNIIKPFYAEKYLEVGLHGKLFLDVSKADFYLPYYTILVCDKMKDYKTIIKMYKIVFKKKFRSADHVFIGNIIYNLQFFIEHAKDDDEFIILFKEYVQFLLSINYPVFEEKSMVYFKKYGIIQEVCRPTFTQAECLKSNNILIYAGFSGFKWNYSYSINNALGGSETAVFNLANNFSTHYQIYISGNVEEETVDNIHYIPIEKLGELIEHTAFHTIIVSRYLNFYENYQNFSAHQTVIWGHDIILFPYGTNMSMEDILTKWSSRINGCICQTEWHRQLFLSLYPPLKDKINVINNGISIELFNSPSKKISNRFIYTSCSERGLNRLIELWPAIVENIPDAELCIASYNPFPSNVDEYKLKTIMDNYSNITHLGKLNKTELYDLMATSEYWLYPTNFNETSCITSMEMLMSEVICIYYPLAGLVNTLGDYGIPVERGQEIETIANLTTKRKVEIRKSGKKYALSCSWKNRANCWTDLFFETNISKSESLEKIWVFHPGNFNYKPVIQYIENLTDGTTKTVVSNDIVYINNLNPDEITFLLNPHNIEIKITPIDKFNSKHISFLQLEPLSLQSHLNKIISFFDIHPHLKQYPIYDYSKSNIRILNKNGFTNCIHLPYKCVSDELDFLMKSKTTPKEYDFGFIYDWSSIGSTKNSVCIALPRRKKVIDFLINNGFTVNIIAGYGEDRDVELGKCDIILNVHGQINSNPNPFPDECSNIFEHIRCDRLLKAGYNILSETSYDLDAEFINQYPNLKIINYKDFCNLDLIKKIISEYNIQHVS